MQAEKLKHWIITTVISRLLKKKCPDIISDNRTNCFAVFVKSRSDSNKKTFINSISEGNLIGQWKDLNRILHDETILISSLDFSDISIRQYFRGSLIEYDSLIKFLIRVNYYEVKSELEKLTGFIHQFFYNRKKLVMLDRIQLLRKLVKCYYENGEQGVSGTGLLIEIYSVWYVLHPQADELREKLTIFLKSFIMSGELTSTSSGNYVVTGKAILTLDQYEQEERRHQQNVRLQWLIVLLTIILALSALIQAQVIKINWFLDLSAVCDKLQSFFH